MGSRLNSDHKRNPLLVVSTLPHLRFVESFSPHKEEAMNSRSGLVRLFGYSVQSQALEDSVGHPVKYLCPSANDF
jgi:hypothetical protein